MVIYLSSHYPWRQFSIWELWNGAVSLLERMGRGVWEGFSRGVNERQWKAQWSSDANCFYSHSSPLPVSDFSTSNDLPLLLSPPSLLSLSSSAPSIPFFPLFHVFFFLSHFPSCLYTNLLPSTSPCGSSSYIPSPSIHLNLRGVPVASICMW